MSNIKLSILIPSIPSRFDKMVALYTKISEQCKGLPVEVLCFIDNKKRSIGEKRNALVQMANGEYLAFVDDDEDIFANYFIQVLTAIQQSPDVVTFLQLSTIDGKSFIVDMDLNNPKNDEAKKDKYGNYYNIKRKPFHICVWRTSIAKSEHFKKVGYGEDWDWCKRLLKKTHTQVKINQVLHHYIFDSNITEAPTESNEIWQNPNHIEDESSHS